MSSSARPPRVIRSAPAAPAEVFVVGSSRPAVPIDAPIATAAEVIAAAEARAQELLRAARAEAESIRAAADALAEEARRQGFEAGRQEGLQAAQAEAAGLLALVRAAAAEAAAAREQIIRSSADALTEALLLALRRIVGQAYAADPGLTALAVSEAVRAAAGQEILSIRVNPGVEAEVTAALGDLGAYVRPDDAVAIGGCLVDLRHGTIDAALDTRLDLAEAAIRAAGGAP